MADATVPKGAPVRSVSLQQVPPGEDLSRILSLSDGVFAFALTLLVLTLAVPLGLTNGQLGVRLHDEYAAFLGYGFAFFLIANWWIAHHRQFSYFRRYDGPLIGINMTILLEIAVMPFVLNVFANYAGDQFAVVLFAATQTITGLTFVALWVHATRDRRLVDPDLDPAIIRYTARRGLLTPIVFGVSIAISFVSVTAAEVFWVAMFIVPRLSEHYGLASPD